MMTQTKMPPTKPGRFSDAKLGSVVQVKLWSYPDMTLFGAVDEVESSAEKGELGKVVYVICYIENPTGMLVSGLTGFAKIEGEETMLAIAFTRAFMRFLRIEVWSWLP